MAKASQTEKNILNIETKVKFEKDFLAVGNLFSQIGSIGRLNGESFVLVKDDGLKTTANGIIAIYKFNNPLGLNESFTLIDSKMLFDRQEGEYQISNDKNSKRNIIVKGKGRKTTIPTVTFLEYDNVEQVEKHISFNIPSDTLVDSFLDAQPEETLIKFRASKEEIETIKKYQSYFRHNSNEETFTIERNVEDGKIMIVIDDKSPNAKREEIEIKDGVEIDNLKSKLTVIFSPKFMLSDEYIITVYEKISSSGVQKYVKFEAVEKRTIYFTSVQKSVDDVIDDEMQKRMAEIDDDFITDDEFNNSDDGEAF